MGGAPKAGPEYESLFAVVIAAFARDKTVAATRKFSTINLTTSGKVFAFTNKAGLVVKLPGPQIDQMVATGEAARLVMGKRTMKEWAVVPPHGPPWVRIAREARAFAGEGSVT